MASKDLVSEPAERKLRVFATDPGLAADYGTASIGQITIGVRWEKDLCPGPVGEYIEVVDADPASGCFYHPVDLNDQRILAQNGLAPSETNPQFHQQMVYAVAMATIGHFEQALGRVALWSSSRRNQPNGAFAGEQFVRRLRIYPHALRDRNAYYSPQKKALLFGYFPAGIKDANNTSDAVIFSALSHDIIAHETTHALLDGVHPRFNEPVNADVLAFHEAFADIVALFQHFAYPGVLRHQIAQTRGDLSGENLLAKLAQQFGQATGRGGALRDALGEIKDGKWQVKPPNVHELERAREPHARGAVLVAAVFGAFLKVYRARTVDLYRIASDGTGVLKPGDIHPDLSNRLADEAARCAQSILQMCIRAIDYCPPVGITFGDYLRALVTADHDLNPDDPYGYRLAMVESFKQWGIYPPGMSSMSVEALLWPTGPEALERARVSWDAAQMQALFDKHRRVGKVDMQFRPWNLESDRYDTWKGVDNNAKVLWHWLMQEGRQLMPALGLVIAPTAPPTVFRSRTNGRPSVEVHSVRTALRRSPRGATVTDLVVEITQRRRGYFDAETQRQKDAGGQPGHRVQGDFRYRAGCTVLIDPVTMNLRRIIPTAGRIDDDAQLGRVRQFLTGELQPDNAFQMAREAMHAREPFALLHRHSEE